MPADTAGSRGPSWHAARTSPTGRSTDRPSPADIDHHWQPLVQAWRPAGLEPGFQPGWARVSWDESFLRFEIYFKASAPSNRARGLNERTWELGDICEVFLGIPDTTDYLELHVTPENQRLQLRWRTDGLERFRAGAAPLADFLVADASWVESVTAIAQGYWFTEVVVPAAVLGCAAFAAGTALRAAVCRYDCDGRPEPVFSSTAPLRELSYHRRQDWQDLVLTEAPSTV
ncbi:MAG: hypothetical protein EXS38_10965 [Opitutus sp.]|nr:hypothetical protein [Opitutus sp.]